MRFEELKKNLVQKIEYVYVLSGIDEYLLDSAYKLIVKYSQIDIPDLNLIKYGEGIIDFDDVIRSLNTLPVFCNKKIVYLDLKSTKKSDIKNINALNDYLKCPNNSSVLIINIGSNSDVFTINNPNIIQVDCSRLPYNIVELKIKNMLEKYSKEIEEDAIEILYNLTLGDLQKISMEINKLIAFVGENKKIQVNDIREIVTPSLEYQVFELTDALAKKDSSKVFSIINDMKSKKDEYKTLPSIIFSHFRRLFMVALNQDRKQVELSKLLNVKEYAVKMSIQQVNLFSKSSLKKINELCNKVDYDLKQSNISLDNAINLIVLTILNL